MDLPHSALVRTAFRTALVTLLLAAAFGAAQAQWVWKDKDGRVNASDLPPPRGTPDKDIMQRPEVVVRRAAPAASEAAASAPAFVTRPPVSDAQLESRKRAAEQEQQAKAKADEQRLAAQRAENCRRARNQLAALESGQRIARMNERGEREVLDDQGRAEETRRANEVIASDCR